MLAKIIGLFLIITGVFFLIKPATLQKRLEKKGAKKIRRYLFALMLVVGILLISATWKMHGIIAIIIMIIGIIFIIKGFLLFKVKAAEKFIDWISQQPELYFRIYAVIQISIGLLCFFGLKK